MLVLEYKHAWNLHMLDMFLGTPLIVGASKDCKRRATPMTKAWLLCFFLLEHLQCSRKITPHLETNSSPLKIDVWNTTVLNRKVYFHGQTGTGFVFCVPKCVDFSHFNITPFGAMFIFFFGGIHLYFFLITFTQGKPQVGKKSCSFMHHSHHHSCHSHHFIGFSRVFFCRGARGSQSSSGRNRLLFFPMTLPRFFLKKRFPLPIPPSLPSSWSTWGCSSIV